MFDIANGIPARPVIEDTQADNLTYIYEVGKAQEVWDQNFSWINKIHDENMKLRERAQNAEEVATANAHKINRLERDLKRRQNALDTIRRKVDHYAEQIAGTVKELVREAESNEFASWEANR